MLLVALGFVSLSLVNTIRVQGVWQLVAVDGAPVDYPESAAHLTFYGGSVGGNEDCNSFDAHFTVLGPWINILDSTAHRFCRESLDFIPTATYLRLVKGWSRISISGARLQMQNGGVTLEFAQADTGRPG